MKVELAKFPGFVTIEETDNGIIRHVLSVDMRGVDVGWLVAIPAGIPLEGPASPFQQFSQRALVIAKALQDYGAYVEGNYHFRLFWEGELDSRELEILGEQLRPVGPPFKIEPPRYLT